MSGMSTKVFFRYMHISGTLKASQQIIFFRENGGFSKVIAKAGFVFFFTRKTKPAFSLL